MNLDKLWETKMRLEQINRNVPESGVDLPGDKRGSFESRHKRVTLYLENSTFLALQSIRNQGVSGVCQDSCRMNLKYDLRI